jgi:para-nitrobenzyl esterase
VPSQNVYGFVGSDSLRDRDPSGATGSYGIQDQRASLQWVRANAAAFGGNPHKVTIDGCAAGAGSTANHIVNPRSWPYFDQAAGESGTFAKWDVNSMQQAERYYADLQEKSGCGKDVACLLALNATALSAAALRAEVAAGTNNGCTYAPVVDGVEIAAEPHELAARGQWFKGPVLLGTARDELANASWAPIDITRGEFIAAEADGYASAGANATLLAELYAGHPADDWGRSEWWWAAASQEADFSFHCPARVAARTFAGAGGGVWLYSYNVTNVQQGCVTHCSQLVGALLSHGPPDMSTAEGRLDDTMAHYWLSFIRTGDPSAERRAQAPEWPRFTNDTGASIAFALPADGGISTEHRYRQRTCDYWETLRGFPDASQPVGGLIAPPSDF